MNEERLENSKHQNFIKVKSGSASEDVYFSLFCKDLPKDLIENALREVNETEENRTKGIESLKKFLREKDLRCENEELLIWVLRNCKYNIKKSENKLERFLQTRRVVGRSLAQAPISLVIDILNELSLGALPYRDKHGRIILFVRPFLQVGNYDNDLAVAVLISCVMFFLSLPKTSLFGNVYLVEADGVSFFLMYPLMKYYKSYVPHSLAIPVRIRKVDIVKVNFAARWVYKAVSFFIPRKINERISFYGSEYKNLLEIYPPDILPKEFGGHLGPLNDEHYRKELLSFIEELKSEYA